jgi:hypothetical protein
MRAENKSRQYGSKISMDKEKQVPTATSRYRRTDIFQYTVYKTPGGVLDLFAAIQRIVNIVLLITNFLKTFSGPHNL